MIFFSFMYAKGTESIISSDPPLKDCNVLFTIVPLKDMTNQE